MRTAAKIYKGLSFGVFKAKNANSLRKGFAPEMLVLGKHTRMPGSVCSDELLPAHLLADSDTAQGLSFRRQLAFRECARKALITADNDSALRKAFLRRSHPIQKQYLPGQWVMVWREGKGAYPGSWQGPMKVVVHESAQVIWTTMASKLFRAAPEMIRPVTAMEARNIQLLPGEASVSKIAQQLEGIRNQGVTQSVELTAPPSVIPAPPQETPQHTNTPPEQNTVPESEPHSESQPDDEPQAPSEHSSAIHPGQGVGTDMHPNDPPPDIPVPSGDTDDDLVCEGLICEDVEPAIFYQTDENVGWRCEIFVTEEDI